MNAGDIALQPGTNGNIFATACAGDGIFRIFDTRRNANG